MSVLKLIIYPLLTCHYLHNTIEDSSVKLVYNSEMYILGVARNTNFSVSLFGLGECVVLY
jgi:hypothetical protein